jgi:hypothetical protein
MADFFRISDRGAYGKIEPSEFLKTYQKNKNCKLIQIGNFDFSNTEQAYGLRDTEPLKKRAELNHFVFLAEETHPSNDLVFIDRTSNVIFLVKMSDKVNTIVDIINLLLVGRATIRRNRHFFK